jgi:hypothetical protein
MWCCLVASLYRAIFKLMLANSCVEETKIDRTVEREIAAALESVFPQAGLNAFNMMRCSSILIHPNLTFVCGVSDVTTVVTNKIVPMTSDDRSIV